MSREAERITITGERAPGGVPNLSPAQYMLASRPDMWPVAEAILAAQKAGEPARLTDQQQDALVACRLWHPPGDGLPGAPRMWTRVWCLTALAIRDAHNAGLARNPHLQA